MSNPIQHKRVKIIQTYFQRGILDQHQGKE